MHGMATENEGAREHHTHKRRLSREDEPILLDHLSFWVVKRGPCARPGTNRADNAVAKRPAVVNQRTEGSPNCATETLKNPIPFTIFETC